MNKEKTNKKLNTQPYKGARDFFPEDMQALNYIFDTWKKVCKKYGFEQYSFPVLEPFEIFAAKTGEEIVNNQLFSFTDKGDRKLAMRPELTPGTVRMIAQKYNELQKPLKWFMIGDNWRYEKPQLGRNREFFQLEINIFGVKEVTADFEIFQTAISIMKEFGATENQFEIIYSDRKLVKTLLTEVLSFDEEYASNVRRTMDKRGKLTDEGFCSELESLGLTNDQIQKINDFMDCTLKNMSNVIPENILNNNQGYKNILDLEKLLKAADLNKYCRFDPSIIRGFDYSDGIVYEFFDLNPKNKRSIFGGERFDKLINIFGDFELPATGYAMGDVTLLEFLKNWNLLPKFKSQIDYLLTLWPEDPDNKYFLENQKLADQIRQKNKNVTLWLEPETKLDKQLKYADNKNIPYVIIIGENELSQNKITIKELKTGEQKLLSIDEFLSTIK